MKDTTSPECDNFIIFYKQKLAIVKNCWIAVVSAHFLKMESLNFKAVW